MGRLPYLLASMLLAGITAGSVSLSAQPAPATGDFAALKAGYDGYCAIFANKDLKAIVAMYAPDVFIFADSTPREFRSRDAFWKNFSFPPGPAKCTISELSITVVGSVAYTHYVDDETVTLQDGAAQRAVYRITDVLRKRNGKWLVVLEHISFPIDETGKADILSKP